MSGIGALALSLGGSALGEVAKQGGYALGKLTGYNDSVAADQLNQQQKLTDMQGKANLALMKESYKQQKQLWEDTQAPAQIAQLRKAGLNPALLYKGGAGGSTSGGGSTSVGGGSASSESDRSNSQNQTSGMGLQMMKAASEIANIKADTKKKEADTKTVDESREWLVEKMKQEGKGDWLENVQREYALLPKDADGTVTVRKWVNNKYSPNGIMPDESSLFGQKATADILSTLASANNAEANALLTNEKAKGYFQELLNDTARADSSKIQATASKLAAEFNTGVFTNWKTWTELTLKIVNDLLKLK